MKKNCLVTTYQDWNKFSIEHPFLAGFLEGCAIVWFVNIVLSFFYETSYTPKLWWKK